MTLFKEWCEEHGEYESGVCRVGPSSDPVAILQTEVTLTGQTLGDGLVINERGIPSGQKINMSGEDLDVDQEKLILKEGALYNEISSP